MSYDDSGKGDIVKTFTAIQNDISESQPRPENKLLIAMARNRNVESNQATIRRTFTAIQELCQRALCTALFSSGVRPRTGTIIISTLYHERMSLWHLR